MSYCLIPVPDRVLRVIPCPVQGCPVTLTSVRTSFSDRRQTFLAHLRKRHSGDLSRREASLIADGMAREG
ncbi:MAG TPA: hypothetical protein VGG32_02640 [Thermoplasmata archaeon]